MSDSVEGILDLKDRKTSKIAKNMSDSYLNPLLYQLFVLYLGQLVA